MENPKSLVLTEEHHRRPRSLGGSGNLDNISYVPSHNHKCWHVLFGNFNAFQIALWLNHSSFVPEGSCVECVFINGVEVSSTGSNNSNNKNKIIGAWEGLFGSMPFSEIVAYINNTWLDPSYHLYIRKK